MTRHLITDACVAASSEPARPMRMMQDAALVRYNLLSHVHEVPAELLELTQRWELGFDDALWQELRAAGHYATPSDHDATRRTERLERPCSAPCSDCKDSGDGCWARMEAARTPAQRALDERYGALGDGDEERRVYECDRDFFKCWIPQAMQPLHPYHVARYLETTRSPSGACVTARTGRLLSKCELVALLKDGMGEREHILDSQQPEDEARVQFSVCRVLLRLHALGLRLADLAPLCEPYNFEEQIAEMRERESDMAEFNAAQEVHFRRFLEDTHAHRPSYLGERDPDAFCSLFPAGGATVNCALNHGTWGGGYRCFAHRQETTGLLHWELVMSQTWNAYQNEHLLLHLTHRDAYDWRGVLTRACRDNALTRFLLTQVLAKSRTRLAVWCPGFEYYLRSSAVNLLVLLSEARARPVPPQPLPEPAAPRALDTLTRRYLYGEGDDAVSLPPLLEDVRVEYAPGRFYRVDCGVRDLCLYYSVHFDSCLTPENAATHPLALARGANGDRYADRTCVHKSVRKSPFAELLLAWIAMDNAELDRALSAAAGAAETVAPTETTKARARLQYRRALLLCLDQLRD